MSLSPADMITKAKIQLRVKDPFFASLVMYMDEKETEDVPTMGVDAHGRLYYNKNWVSTCTQRQINNVICHEVLHVALSHMLRKENRDMKIFNIAADIKVNDMLDSEGKGELPSGGIIVRYHRIDMGKYSLRNVNDLTVEAIYNEILNNVDEKDLPEEFDSHFHLEDGDSPSDKDGTNDSAGSKLPTDPNEISETWKGRLVSAATEAKAKGSCSSGIARLIDELLKPYIPWNNLLFKYVQQSIVVDYTWSRPSKASMACGIYLPSPYKENIDVVAHFDTSGSVSNDELRRYLTELYNLLKSYSHICIHLITGDSKLCTYNVLSRYNNIEPKDVNISGGGGTSHSFVLDWIEENKPQTRLLISFTDGYSDIDYHWGKREPTFDTIFIAEENNCLEKMSEYGQLIKVRSE